MKIWTVLFLWSTCNAIPNYFDPSFLVQYDAVNQALKNDGFQEVHFTTQDNLQLNALLSINPNARANIICFAGWYPGRKETLAPFFTMFGKEYNMLLVDARGHGISQGPLFSNAWHYGITDYYDAFAALEYMHQNTQKPTFIIGLCAGAFNATHAAIALGATAHEKGLRGIVFDSGWASVYDTSYTAPTAHVRELLAKTIARVYSMNPHQAQRTFLWNLCSTISCAWLYSIHTLLFKPAYAYYDTVTNLNNKIAQCSTPIFFIHSYDDTYADIKKVQILAARTPHKKCWWIREPSKHTGHHFKHTKLYQEKVSQFFNSIYDSLTLPSK